MPPHEGIDALVHLLGRLAMQIKVRSGLPFEVSVGVFVNDARGAAAAQAERDEQDKTKFHQKLSTLMCPGARRRCLRSPRSMSTAVVSLSMSGLPHSMKCERAEIARPAAASSRPSLIAAGMRPASEPERVSRLTMVT